jgi:hypothetical protein
MAQSFPNFMSVSYTALTDEDLKGILKVCKLNPRGLTPKEVVQRIAAQQLSFWRLREDDADVRLILEIRVHPGGNELFIFGVFGRGLFGKISTALEFCKLIANKYFCQEITGNVYSKGLAKLYEGIGAKPIYTKYMLEG